MNQNGRRQMTDAGVKPARITRLLEQVSELLPRWSSTGDASILLGRTDALLGEDSAPVHAPAGREDG
jgi:hypothetical protein